MITHYRHPSSGIVVCGEEFRTEDTLEASSVWPAVDCIPCMGMMEVR